MQFKKLLLFTAIVMAGHSYQSHAQGVWHADSVTALSSRSFPSSFVVANYAYVGTGLLNTSALAGSKDFWRFNPDSGTWTQVADFPGAARWGCFAFSIGLYGYVGTGRDAAGTSYDDFYRYEVSTNTWSSRATYPGGIRRGAVGMSCDNKGYAGLGWNGANYFDDWYEYDPTGDTWTVRSSFTGGAINYPVGYSIGNKCYVGTGYDGSSYHSEFYHYDPAIDTWTGFQSFPGTGRYAAAAFTLGEYAFVTAGVDAGTQYNDCYRIDTTTLTWVRMSDFPSGTRYTTAFGLKGHGYVFEGDSFNTLMPFIWKYDTTNLWSKPANSVWCSGSTQSVDLVLNDSLLAGNTFELFISDSSGDFGTQTSLGNISAYQGVTLPVSVLTGLPAGNNYRLRTISSTPGITGFASQEPIIIRPVPDKNVQVNGSTSICGGGQVDMWVDSTGFNYHKNLIKITYDATLGSGGLAGSSKVYLHTGTADTNLAGSNWYNTVGNWGQDDGVGKMDSLGNDKWSITLDVPSWYAVGYGYPVTFLGLLFRNEDGTKDGRDSSGNEVYINMQTGAKPYSYFTGVTVEYVNSIQWQVNGSNINGATNYAYSATTGGDFRAVVSGGYCADTSVAVTVISGTAPQVSIKTNGATSACLSSQNFSYTDASTGAVYLRMWDFGDGTFDTALNTTHTYTAAGNYYVKLYVFAQGGCFTVDSVQATVYPGPSVSFSINNTSQCLSGNSFAFTDGSTTGSGSITTWAWNFGDGNTASSQNPTHSYTTAGNYTVWLKATNSGGCFDSTSKTLDVNPSPIAAFGINAATQCLSGNSFQFSDSSTIAAGSISSLAWTYGDGNSGNGSSPSHSYTSTGNFTVTLTATSDKGCTHSTQKTVDVLSKPTATITPGGGTTFCQGGSVSLVANQSSGLTYQWFLNNNPIGGATSDTHNATVSGDYTVAIIAQGGCGDTSVATTVTVNPMTTASASAAGATSFCQGGSVVLNAVTGSGLTYQWQVNGTDISGANTDSYTANASGDYTVIVTTGGQCSDTSTAITVTVMAKTSASATAGGATSFCQGGSVTLSANSGGGLGYQWLKDGSPISGATSETYSATATGSYQAIVTPTGGCSDTSTAIAVTVNPTVSVGTISGPNTATAGSTKSYFVVNIAGAVFTWTATGGTVQTGQGTASVTVLWSNPGSGSLEVTTDKPCSDTGRLAVAVNTGISSPQLQGLTAYPNPGNGRLQVSLPAVVGQLVVMDMAGKQVTVLPVTGQQMAIDLSNLPAGMYVLQHSSPAGISRQQVVIQH